MKTSRVFAIAMAVLAAGFFAGCWRVAQSSNKAAEQSYDFGALQQFDSFVKYLQDTKQTNILQRFNELSNASLASRHYADLGVTLIILQNLREGHTNEAYELLEGNLDDDIVGFAVSYRELPASLRDQTSLKILRRAKDYRAKYQNPYHSQVIDDAVTNAFKILDDK